VADTDLRRGRGPAYVALPPIARYVWLLALSRHLSYAQAMAGEPPWVRPAGMAQMLLYLASLAPFGGPLTRLGVSIAAPVVTPIQLVVLALLYRQKTRVVRGL
jgi:hypothetical protein